MTISKKSPAVPDRAELLAGVRWALRKCWETSSLLCAGLLATALIGALVPAALAVSIGALAASLKPGSADQAFDPAASWLWLVGAVGLTLLASAATSVHGYCVNRLTDELHLTLSLEILEHSSRLELAFFEDADAQDVLQRATQQPGRHFVGFLGSSIDAASSVVRAGALLAVLLWIEPLSTPFLVLAAVPFAVHRWRLAKQRYQVQHARATQRRWSAYYSSQFTAMGLVGSTRLLGLGPLLSRRFEGTLREVMQAMQRLYRRQMTGQISGAALYLVGFTAALGWIGWRAYRGDLSLGPFVAYALAALRLRASLTTLAKSSAFALEESLFITNLTQFLATQPTISDVTVAEHVPIRGALELVGVSFTYPGADRPALERISMRIPAGATVAIVGHNGSGKTTLAKLIAQLYEVGDGQIRLGGTDIRQLSLDRYHEQIGIVFEGPVGYEATVHENIAFGDWRRLLGNRQAVHKAAAGAGLLPLIESLPEGFDTRLGRAFGQTTLSRGQWQRVAIARALARSPHLLILDEPTSALDVYAERDTFRAIRTLAANATTILISHRFSTVQMADRIFVLEEGRLVEEGSHSDLVGADGLYARLYRIHGETLAGKGLAAPLEDD